MSTFGFVAVWSNNAVLLVEIEETDNAEIAAPEYKACRIFDLAARTRQDRQRRLVKQTPLSVGMQ